MAKRNKLEIIKDILTIIKNNRNAIRHTPLLRKTNISSLSFREYYSELIEKKFIQEINSKNTKTISLTEKGMRFLEKYQTIVHFIEEFGL